MMRLSRHAQPSHLPVGNRVRLLHGVLIAAGVTALVLIAPEFGDGLQAQAPRGRFALEFNGDSSFVWLNKVVPDGLGEGTVEVWFRLLRPWRGRGSMALFGDDARRLNLVLEGPRLAFYKQVDSGWPAEASDPHVVRGPLEQLDVGWHHVAGVWGDQGMRLFLDGKRLGARPYTSPYRDWDLESEYDIRIETRLGIAYDHAHDGVARFEGQMAFVRVCRESLYDEDFKPDLLAVPRSSQELLRYNFAEGDGAVLHDSGPEEHDAKICGCVWRDFDPNPTFAPEPLADQSVLFVPFGADRDVIADASQLEGFHLTASWLLNYFGHVPVVTEEEIAYLVPRSRFPHREKLALEDLSQLRAETGAAAVVWGYLEPDDNPPGATAGPGGSAGLMARSAGPTVAPGEHSVRLTTYAWRPDAPLWQTSMTFDSYSDAAFSEAQQSVGRQLFELLAPTEHRTEPKGLPADEVPLELEFQLDLMRDHILQLDTFSLVQAINGGHRQILLEPRGAATWRLLAEAYAWLGGSLDVWYSGFPLVFRGRARAAQNIALILDGPSVQNQVAAAAVARLGFRYGPGREAAQAIDPELLEPRERALLALAESRTALLDEVPPQPVPFYPFVRGWIRLINRYGWTEGLEEAWQLNPLLTCAPGMMIEPLDYSTRARIMHQTPAPGLYQASRLLIWASLNTSSDTGAANRYLRSASEILGQPPAALPDDEVRRLNVEVIDQVVREVLPLENTTTALPFDQAVQLLAALRNLEHDIRDAPASRQVRMHQPGEAAVLGPDTMCGLALLEGQSGFQNLIKVYAGQMGNGSAALEMLNPMLDIYGFDTVTAFWTQFALSKYSQFAGQLPWVPRLWKLAPDAWNAYYYSNLTGVLGADAYVRAKCRHPYWVSPWVKEGDAEAYRRDPFNYSAARLWMRELDGEEKRARIEELLAQSPESGAILNAAGMELLRDFRVRDEARALEMVSVDQGAEYDLDMGRPERALDRLLSNLDRFHNHVEIAEVYRAAGRQDEARKILETATKIGVYGAGVEYGRLLAESGDLDTALSWFDQVRYAEERARGMRYRLAALYKARGSDQAYAVLDLYLEEHPRSKAYITNQYIKDTGDLEIALMLDYALSSSRLGNTLIARAALEAGKLDLAIDAAKEAIRTEGAYPDKTDPEEAARLWAQAVGQQAVGLYSAGQPDKARTRLEAFVHERGLSNFSSLLRGLFRRDSDGPSTSQAAATDDQAPQLEPLLASIEQSADAADPGRDVVGNLRSIDHWERRLAARLRRSDEKVLTPGDRLRRAVGELLGLRLADASGYSSTIGTRRVSEGLRVEAVVALADSLLALNPEKAHPFEQALLYWRAHPDGTREDYLRRAGQWNLSQTKATAHQEVVDSWADWWMLGPIADRKLDGMYHPYVDESRPIDFQSKVQLDGESLGWSRPYPNRPWGGVRLDDQLRATLPEQYELVYAFREIEVPAAAVMTMVLRGSQSARVLLNQQELGHWIYTEGSSEEMLVELPLKAGRNELLVKMRFNNEPESQFAHLGRGIWCRFSDSGSGP